MKLTHELFLLLHAVNALENARLAVRLALRDGTATNKRWMLQWAREEAARYAPRLAWWWHTIRELTVPLR